MHSENWVKALVKYFPFTEQACIRECSGKMLILPFLLLHEVQEDLYQSLHMENLMELLEMKHITYWSLPNTAAPGSSTLSS